MPKNPEKYIGDYKGIWARSSWETRVFNWCDTSKNIVKWSSEEIVIMYVSPLDMKYHRYFPDVMIKVPSGGTLKTYLLEIKPKSQIDSPIRGKKKKSTYINEVARYAVNQAKWNAAEAYCNDRGWVFKTVSEIDLGLTK